MPKLVLFDKIVVFLNIIYLIILVISGVNYFSPMEGMAIFFILNVALPFYIIGLFLFVIYSFYRKKPFLIILNSIGIIFWYFFLGPFYMINYSQPEIAKRELRIMTLNTLGFKGNYNMRDENINEKFEALIIDQNPDIICLQEFSPRKRLPYVEDNYPYSYIHRETSKANKVPLAIFSKHPILNKVSINFPNTGNNAVFVDVELQKDTIRIFNIHLQSLKVRPGSFKREQPQQLLARIGASYSLQLQQVKTVKKYSEESPYKNIICGDFNNTQYSGIVNLLKQDMKDSFLEKGKGYGRTYNFKFLPFRIDYIMVDKSFEVLDHQNFDIELSDHYPIMASIQLSPN